jgi:hypothetical protein
VKSIESFSEKMPCFCLAGSFVARKKHEADWLSSDVVLTPPRAKQARRNTKGFLKTALAGRLAGIVCFGVLVALVAGGECVAAQPRAVTAQQKLEIDTLTNQLTDPKRSQTTRFEAARLLLTRSYPQAREVLAQGLGDATKPATQIAIAEAIEKDGGGHSVFVKSLLLMLTGEQPTVRAAAARALATYRNEGVMQRLFLIAVDAKRDRAIRLVTIDALQHVVTPECIATLISLLGDADGAVAAAASESLQRLTGIHHFQANQRRWQGWWRKNRGRTKVQWLAAMADSLTRANMSLLKDNTALRGRLVQAMVDLYEASPKAGRDAILVAMFADPIGDVRLLGATLLEKRILANQPAGEAVATAARVLLDDTDARVRTAAAKLMASLGGKGMPRMLLTRLKTEAIPEVRVALLDSLGQLRASSAVATILTRLPESAPPEATAAASALARIASATPLAEAENTRVSQALVARYKQAVRHKNSDTLREALLTAMGVTGAPVVKPVLISALQDPAGVIRLAGVAGLARLRVTEAVASLAPLVADADRGVRCSAIEAIAALGGWAYLDAILARTDPKVESDAAVRTQAAAAVETLCAALDAKTFASVLATLGKKPHLAALRIKVLQAYVATLAKANTPRADVLRSLGEALLAGDRPDEAAAAFDQALTLLAADKTLAPAASQPLRVAHARALLAAGDPAMARAAAALLGPAASPYPTGKKEFAQLMRSLAAMQKTWATEKRYAVTIAVLDAVLAQLNANLDPTHKKAFLTQLAAARQAQRTADRQAVTKLLSHLLNGDPAAKAKASEQFEAMGPRAVSPLLDALGKRVAATPPDPKGEADLLSLLKRIAPELIGYDPKADQPRRLATIAQWKKNLTP